MPSSVVLETMRGEVKDLTLLLPGRSIGILLKGQAHERLPRFMIIACREDDLRTGLFIHNPNDRDSPDKELGPITSLEFNPTATPNLEVSCLADHEEVIEYPNGEMARLVIEHQVFFSRS